MAFALAWAVTGFAACGGGGSPTAPGANPGPSTTPTPGPTPTPDPRAGLARGPITRLTIKPRIVEPDVRDPEVDAPGRYLAFNTGNGVVYRRGSSQRFLLKLNIESRGTFSVRGSSTGSTPTSSSSSCCSGEGRSSG